MTRQHISRMRAIELKWLLIVGFWGFACACGYSVQVPANTFDVQDGGVLSGYPCSPPCFWNIIPGTTTKDQATELLKNIGVYETCRTFDYTAESGRRGLQCSTVTVFVSNNADVVSGIGFSPSYDISVDEIIKRFGAPDGVLVTPVGIPESEPKTSMMIYYDRLFMDIRLVEAKASMYNLESGTKVTNIGYYDESSYKMIKQSYTDWKGYGIYEIRIP